VRSVALSYDGSAVIAGSDDNYIYLFDKTFTANTYVWRYLTEDYVSTVSISDTGTHMVAGSKDSNI